MKVLMQSDYTNTLLNGCKHCKEREKKNDFKHHSLLKQLFSFFQFSQNGK